MRFLKWCDKMLNKTVQKGGGKPWLGYAIKYFLSVGIGMHLILLFVIIIQIVT